MADLECSTSSRPYVCETFNYRYLDIYPRLIPVILKKNDS